MKSQPATRAELDRALYSKVGKRYLDLETQLLHSVLDYLGMIGLKAFRRNVGAREWVDAQGKTRLVMFGEKGQSDIWVIGPFGTHIEIELKKPNAGARSEPNENQRAWLKDVRQAGAIGLSVTSLEQLAYELELHYLERGWKWKASWRLR